MKWKSVHLSVDSVKKAARHPSLLAAFIKGAREADLAKQHVAIELTSAGKLFNSMAGEIPYQHPLDVMSYVINHNWNKCYGNGFLYAICRWFNPGVVVETGVHYGASTSFILSALNDNQAGHLYSIDAPNRVYNSSKGKHSDLLPDGCETGFVVPQFLKSRWTLIPGTSYEKLAELLDKVGNIDIFFHDSEHTYETMLFEFKEAWPKLKPGGLLIADDVLWNKAFIDFCSSVECNYNIQRGKGFAYKS